MKKHTTKKVRVSRKTRSPRGETPEQRGMRLLQEREVSASAARLAHELSGLREKLTAQGAFQCVPLATLVKECSGDPRQCSTAYCPDCVPGKNYGRGLLSPEEAPAAVGVRGAAPHTAEVPPADRWAPGNTVEGDGYENAPAGVFVALDSCDWLAKQADGRWLQHGPGFTHSFEGLGAPRTIIARPADAPDSIPHYPPRSVQQVQLQPDDLKLGGMVGVQVVAPGSSPPADVERMLALREHAMTLYEAMPGLGVGIADDDFDDLLCSDEALDAVREQLIAQAWGLA